MNKTALLKKIEGIQKKWADGIIAIGEAERDNLGRGEIEKRTKEMLNTLYDFSEDHILFKPTKAAEKPFRFNRSQTKSYFIGGKIEEDKGFALTPWKSVTFNKFKEINIVEHAHDVFVMGSYIFEDDNGKETTVEYTFGYRKEGLKIFLHHSSLPFKPKED